MNHIKQRVKFVNIWNCYNFPESLKEISVGNAL